ncbi:MAG: hypothetical protein AAGD32_13670 [Planctomycetota bacterium]
MLDALDTLAKFSLQAAGTGKRQQFIQLGKRIAEARTVVLEHANTAAANAA